MVDGGVGGLQMDVQVLGLGKIRGADAVMRATSSSWKCPVDLLLPRCRCRRSREPKPNRKPDPATAYRQTEKEAGRAFRLIALLARAPLQRQ